MGPPFSPLRDAGHQSRRRVSIGRGKADPSWSHAGNDEKCPAGCARAALAMKPNPPSHHHPALVRVKDAWIRVRIERRVLGRSARTNHAAPRFRPTATSRSWPATADTAHTSTIRRDLRQLRSVKLIARSPRPHPLPLRDHRKQQRELTSHHQSQHWVSIGPGKADLSWSHMGNDGSPKRASGGPRRLLRRSNLRRSSGLSFVSRD